jgi:tetratricopeptide (TPR) repeat protein
MRRNGIPRVIAAFLIAGAASIAAYFAAESSQNTKRIESLLGVFEGRLGELETSLRSESKALGLLTERSGAAIEAAIAEEGRAGRSELRRQAGRVETELARAIERRDELLSELSLRIDRLDRGDALSMVGAVVKEGRSESLLLRDISLARAMEEAERFYASGRYAEAAARYAAVLDAAPGDALLRRKRAVSLFRANPADSSIYGFIEGELGTESLGDGVDAIGVLASISAERQDWPKALGYFDRLIKLRPKDSGALKDAGECALCAGDKGKAASYFERACAADPSDREAQAKWDFARESEKPE